eukprot:Seg3575.2 transcript_id=Seg3575.2/GoldUCD/mRNA.D3Y31 product="alpha-1B adrenergic receptor" protein_id=Seg3575.2/GoldUCD/D3Y31
MANNSISSLFMMNPTNFTTPRNSTNNPTHNHVSAAMTIGAFTIILAFENYLLIFAVAVKKFKRVPEILMFSLALSSLVNCCTTLVISAYQRALGHDARNGIDTLCKLQFWFSTTLRVNDIFVTTLISIDRFVAITKPFFYRARVRPEHGWISIATAFAISGVISSLPFAGFGSISRIIPSICAVKWDSEISILIVGLAYVQFAIVLWCYIAIIWTVKKLVKRQKDMAKSQQITYDSPSMRCKNAGSPSLSLSPSCETSSTSLEVPSLVDKPVSLRIKAVLNRSYSNYEGSQSDSFGLAKPEIHTKDSLRGSIASIYKENGSLVSISLPNHCGGIESHFAGSSSSLASYNHGELKRSATSPDTLPKDRPHRGGLSNRGILPDDAGSSSLTLNHLRPDINRHLNSLRKKWEGSFMRRKKETSVRKQWQETEHFAKVMGVVVLLFYVSWIPLATSITLTLTIGMTPMILKMTYVSLLMTLGGPFLIPIVYGVMAKAYRNGYRRALKFLFCCGCCKRGRRWNRKIHVNDS